MSVIAPERPLLGSTEPRLWTPPLRELTPETSSGFEVIEFANRVRHPLIPWQEWLAVHAGELLEDGRPRFRIVLVLVSRQNGKTTVPKVLAAYWQFEKHVPLVLGTSTQTRYAKEAWRGTVDLVRNTPEFDDLHAPGRKWYRLTNGETESWTLDGCRHMVAASNDEGGRSLTVHRGIADELRQHHGYDAWDALEPAASPLDAQIWCLSNAGDDRSVVLNDLRESALEYIETGEGDPRLGIFEWSAPEGSDPEDIDALLQANPRVGYGLDLDVLIESARRAKRLGGKALTGFLTERMCIRVPHVDPAIDPQQWIGCLERATLDSDRRRLAACVDLTPSGDHATLAVAAVQADGRVRVETVQEWNGPSAARDLERDLPAWVARVKPRIVGWFPSGPAAAVAAKLADRRSAGVRGWPPPGVQVAEIRGETSAVCMGFGKEVSAGTLAHSGQKMLDAQVDGAEKARRGDAWVFTRSTGPVDAVYAVAGAAHLARTLPTKRQPVRTVRSAG